MVRILFKFIIGARLTKDIYIVYCDSSSVNVTKFMGGEMLTVELAFFTLTTGKGHHLFMGQLSQ